jgi:arylsulfatase A-like enzyme
MPGRRNVLLILADQFRNDCLGAVGNPVIRTPNLDALARKGTLFTKCFVQTNPCGPSRMCLFTGRYLCSNRALTNETPLLDAEENLAMHLQAGGYNPALIGYNDYVRDPRTLPHGHPQKTTPCYDNVLPGFDWVLFHDEYTSPEYLNWLRAKGYPETILDRIKVSEPNVPPEGPGEHLPLRYPAHYQARDSEARFVTQTAMDWIRPREGSGWFLSLNYIKPHSPRVCPAPYHDMYDPSVMPVPSRHLSELENDHPYYQLMRKEHCLIDEMEWRETRACYYGMISELDACLGSLFEFLKETGEWDKTLIIFSSDHGDYMGDHYLLDKAHFFDATMRVPLIIRDPGEEADCTRGRILDRFAESVDLAPTMLEYLGLPVPDRFQGKSLLTVVQGDGKAPRKEEVFFEADFRARSLGSYTIDPDECLFWVVRDDRFKYVQFASETMPPLLFDLAQDPGEFANLAQSPSHAGVVAEYCQKLLRWRMRNEDQRMENWAAIHRRK